MECVYMKRLFALFSISLLALAASGCSKTEKTIFTGLPAVDDTYYKPFEQEIKQFKEDLHSTTIDYGDIWIRDVAPVVTDRLVKFNYSPDYLSKKQSRTINAIFMDWLDKKGFDYEQSKIILEGGNFVYNREDTVIITKRILKDNPEYSQNALITKLKKLLHVRKIILIDEEPGDVLGHADGQVFFIKTDTLFIGDFEGNSLVKKQIKQAAPELKIIDLPSNYQEEGQYDQSIPSARGLYVNMMETDTTLYVPKYGLKTDQQVLDLVSQYTNKKIQTVDVRTLSTLGGSINCLTWYCPNELLPDNKDSL